MKQQYRAENDRERAIALASLPESGLLATIEAHAKEGKKGNADALLWLDTLVKGGFLEMSDSIAWDPNVSGGRGMNTAHNEPFINARAKRFGALMSFVKDIELSDSGRHDPVYGELERSLWTAKLKVDPALVRIFAEACERLVADDKAFFAVSEPSQQSQSRGVFDYRGLAHTHWSEREETFAKAMAAACMMGLTEQVTAMGLRCPEALEYPIDQKEFLGDKLLDRQDKTELCVTPYYCAFQFSQNESIDALVAGGMKGDCHLVVLKYANDKMEHTRYGVEEFIGRNLLPMCGPSTLAKAFRLADAAGKTPDPAMHQAMIDALEGTKLMELDSLLVAFLDTGRLDLTKDSGRLVRAACTHGYPSLVVAMDEANAIPWGNLGTVQTPPFETEQRQMPDSDVITGTAQRATTGGEWVQGKMESALLALFDAAERAGPSQLAGLMAPFMTETHMSGDPESTPLFEPIDSAIQVPFEKVLTRMMQHGLDPNAPYETIGNRSPIQMAEAKGLNAVAHTMRTFVTHQRASRALRELDDMLNEPEALRP